MNVIEIKRNKVIIIYFDETGLGSRYVVATENLQKQGLDVTKISKNVIEDTFLTAPELAQKYGYETEIHEIKTIDGYKLKIHRIVGKISLKCFRRRRRQPVLMMHGLLGSSATWLILGPGSSLPYLLSDMGYDVWMANARGNKYSRDHVEFNANGSRTQRRQYWNFSWHEIGVIDTPAMIDYILSNTDYEKLHYIGYSQGTTTFFVMASELPEYNEKIQTMQALAPVAFMTNLKSPLVRLASLFVNSIDSLMNIIGFFEFCPGKEFRDILTNLNENDIVPQEICKNILFLLFGFNRDQVNTKLLPVFFGHCPDCSSSKQFHHYGQIIRYGQFRQFDLGEGSNVSRYGQRKPPKYNVSNITSSVFLHYGQNDWMADPIDVQKLYNELPNAAGLYKVPHDYFNHIDFILAKDAKMLVYDQVIWCMKEFDKKNKIK